MFSPMSQWLESNGTLVSWLVALSVFIFLGSLIGIPIVLARLRADYFIRPTPRSEVFLANRPVLRAVFLFFRNLLGAVLVVTGVAMLVLPGQGILTSLVGISLLTFPGKRRLELWIIQRKPVVRAVNWIRLRAKRDPLVLPAPDATRSTS